MTHDENWLYLHMHYKGTVKRVSISQTSIHLTHDENWLYLHMHYKSTVKRVSVTHSSIHLTHDENWLHLCMHYESKKQTTTKLLKITVDYLHTVIGFGMTKGIPIPKPSGFISFLCFVVPGILQIVQD